MYNFFKDLLSEVRNKPTKAGQPRRARKGNVNSFVDLFILSIRWLFPLEIGAAE